jgi:hypothetical protein
MSSGIDFSLAQIRGENSKGLSPSTLKPAFRARIRDIKIKCLFFIHIKSGYGPRSGPDQQALSSLAETTGSDSTFVVDFYPSLLYKCRKEHP